MSDNEGRHLEVEEATLFQAAKDLRAAEGDITTHLGTVRGAAQTLGSAWTGQAASAFTNLITRWDNDAKQLVQAMSDIADLLDKAGKSHSMNDQASMDMLNRMDSSVDNILNPHH
jgi:WXG100 family type VII secretion target